MNKHLSYIGLFLLVGCAGLEKSCTSCDSENFGADWVVVQVDFVGKPFRCWALKNVSISNESGSDGIFWKEKNGNLVHISGLYNRVQVVNGNWNSAYSELGLTKESCEQIRKNKYQLLPDLTNSE